MSIQPIRRCGTSGNRKRKMTDSLEKPFIIFYLFNLLLVWERRRRRRGWGGGPEILTSGLIIRGEGLRVSALRKRQKNNQQPIFFIIFFKPQLSNQTVFTSARAISAAGLHACVQFTCWSHWQLMKSGPSLWFRTASCHDSN